MALLVDPKPFDEFLIHLYWYENAFCDFMFLYVLLPCYNFDCFFNHSVLFFPLPPNDGLLAFSWTHQICPLSGSFHWLVFLPGLLFPQWHTPLTSWGLHSDDSILSVVFPDDSKRNWNELTFFISLPILFFFLALVVIWYMFHSLVYWLSKPQQSIFSTGQDFYVIFFVLYPTFRQVRGTYQALRQRLVNV